jgi:hypothetical protein
MKILIDFKCQNGTVILLFLGKNLSSRGTFWSIFRRDDSMDALHEDSLEMEVSTGI